MSEKHRTDHHVVSHERYCELKAAYHRRMRLRTVVMVDMVDFDPPGDGTTAAHTGRDERFDRRGYDDLELWE